MQMKAISCYARVKAILFFTGALLLFLSSMASAQVPAYSAEFMGPGISGAMNNLGHAIGNEGSIWEPGIPWVQNASGFQLLPIPGGMYGALVADINDQGVIVGTVYATDSVLTDLPAQWIPDGTGGYMVEILPLAGNATRGKAVAVNNVGQILVSGFGVAVLPTYTAYVIDEDIDGDVVVTNLGLSNPMDINDNGLILTNRTLFNYPAMTELGIPYPESINAYLYPAALNNNDQVAVNLLTATISNVQYFAIGVYTVGEGWDIVLDPTVYLGVSDINDNGDLLIGGSNLSYNCGGIVYLNGDVFYCSSDLLDPEYSSWTIGANLAITNDRSLLARGTTDAGQFGIIRLSEVGDLPVPDPPINVVATPHEATSQQPFISIDLTWESADTLVKSFLVERKLPNDTDFVQIAEVTTGYSRDSAVEADQVYEYRIIARGVAGNSVPSAVVTVQAPAAPDREAPFVEILSPGNGDTVSGVVPVEVAAADNVAISYIIVTASGMDCRTYNQETASCAWNAKDLPGGDYTITALAVDTLNNYANTSVTVTVEETVKGGGKDKPDNGNGGKGNGKGKGNK